MTCLICGDSLSPVLLSLVYRNMHVSCAIRFNTELIQAENGEGPKITCTGCGFVLSSDEHDRVSVNVLADGLHIKRWCDSCWYL